MSTVFVAVVLSVKKICLTINLCFRLLTSTRWHQTCGKRELPHGMLNTKEWEGVTVFLSLLLVQKMVIFINWVSCVSYGWVLIVPGAISTLGVDLSAVQLVVYFDFSPKRQIGHSQKSNSSLGRAFLLLKNKWWSTLTRKTTQNAKIWWHHSDYLRWSLLLW